MQRHPNAVYLSLPLSLSLSGGRANVHAVQTFNWMIDGQTVSLGLLEVRGSCGMGGGGEIARRVELPIRHTHTLSNIHTRIHPMCQLVSNKQHASHSKRFVKFRQVSQHSQRCSRAQTQNLVGQRPLLGCLTHTHCPRSCLAFARTANASLSLTVSEFASQPENAKWKKLNMLSSLFINTASCVSLWHPLKSNSIGFGCLTLEQQHKKKEGPRVRGRHILHGGWLLLLIS